MAGLQVRDLQEVMKCHLFKDESEKSNTSTDQEDVEGHVRKCFECYLKDESLSPPGPTLHCDLHAHYLRKGLVHLSTSYECLDASRPWLVYWIVHSLDLLDQPIPDEQKTHIAEFLAKCQHKDGGFGGGPQQLPHLAATYAAVLALSVLGTEEAYNVIDRAKLRKFLESMQQGDGSFTVHEGGEVDIRGVYLALSVAKLTNVYSDDLFLGTAEWVASCQTYEGGFGGNPGVEAHGGYTFCGLATLNLLNKTNLADIRALLRWVSNRQMQMEGGFQGRTNKLVDGCYSFWQGGLFPLVHSILSQEVTDTVIENRSRWLFHQEALQEYLLCCCQSTTGGLIDKPGKHADFYHTCYTLSGLSVAQHFAACGTGHIYRVGPSVNELTPVHPLYNISVQAANDAIHYYQKLPSVVQASGQPAESGDTS